MPPETLIGDLLLARGAMSEQKPSGTNPFYVLLVIAGLAFVVTACAYGVMAFRGSRDYGTPPAESGLTEWLDENGGLLLAVEVAALAVLSFAAMATDSYWSGKSSQPKKNQNPPTTSSENDKGESTQ